MRDPEVRPRALLERGLAALSLAQPAEALDGLMELAGMLARWSARMNLTAHRGEEAIVRRLILDAAALSTCLPPLESLADLGSGAGFPGFPIALLRPECRVTLVEARQRRHHFQRAVVRAFGLRNVRLLHGRAEELAPAPQAAAIAQAVAAPATALPWLRRWVAPGGLLLLPGAESPPQLPEIEGVIAEPPRRYRVPCGGPERSLWCGRRSGETGLGGAGCGTKDE